MLPLIILCGQAGSGKDTVASFLVKNHNAISIAQADPMKRLASKVFGFTEDQLWGPSEARNSMDPRFREAGYCFWSARKLEEFAFEYVRAVLPDLDNTQVAQAAEELQEWCDGICAAAPSEGGLSPRKVLQTLGTEWGRKQSRDVWSKYAIRNALTLLGGGYRYDRTVGLIEDEDRRPDYVVISDGRFRNELVNVLAIGGQTWKITAPDADGAAAERAGVVGHKSETEQRSIPDHLFWVSFRNDKSKGLEVCEQKVTDVMWTFGHPFSAKI